MAERFKTIIKKYGVRIIVVLLSMLFLCTFISCKEGYHMDEILAFQLANAEYNPWIVPTQPVGRLAKFMKEHIDGDSLGETMSNVGFIVKDTLANRGESILANYKADVYEAPVWISGEMFRDYVQCDKEDDYNLLSVYFNVKDDNHPPLHFMLLHMMTSLFKGEISVWHGCVINLVAMVITLWLLGLIGDLVFKNKKNSVLLMIMYGFSTAIVATTIWIRMYALLTLWTVWGLYLHLKKYESPEQGGFLRINKKTGKPKWIGSIGILVVTLMSFWTQYFGLFFIIPLALVMVVLLAKDKRLQELWAYIRTMVTAAVIGVCVYPFAIGDVFFSSRGTEALSQWQNGLTEYMNRLAAFGKILAENVSGGVVPFVLAVAIPILFLAFVKVCKKSKEDDGCNLRKGLILGIPTLVYFLLAAKMSPYFVDRYIMAILPMTTLLIVLLWDGLTTWIKREKAVTLMTACMVLFCVICQCVQLGDGHTYLYKGYSEQVEIAKEHADYPLVCLYAGYGFYENVLEMEQYEQTMLVKTEELAAMDAERTQVTANGYVALIKYPGDEAGKGKLEQMMDVFGGRDAKLIYEGGAFGDALYLVTP